MICRVPPLGPNPSLGHLQLHGGGDDHALPQVPHPEHEGGPPVAGGDDGVPGEDKRLGPAVGLCRLHKDAAQHNGVDDQPQDVLDDQHGDGQGTLLCHHPAPEPDGHLQQDGRSVPRQTHLKGRNLCGVSHLDLDGEEEGGSEGMDGGDAGHRARLAVRVTGFQVPVGEGQEPPDHGKQHP